MAQIIFILFELAFACLQSTSWKEQSLYAVTDSRPTQKFDFW